MVAAGQFIEVRRNKCLLCSRKLVLLTSGEFSGLQLHPKADDCLVRFTDLFGISVEPETEHEADPDPGFEIEGLVKYPTVEEALIQIFAKRGLHRLGGQSSGRGWSSVSLFQRCPYAWYRRYIEKAKPFIVGIENPALAIGTLVHVFLALWYRRMYEPDYPLEPQIVGDELAQIAKPEYVQEAWRLFRAYAIYYQHDNLVPLAVEYDLKDPRNGESCRYDLIAFLPPENEDGTRRDGLMPGTYEVESKTAGRFDDATLNGWANDGEVLGQVMLWNRLGLDKRFGPLRGAIVNIIGKQKDPQFHRTIVAAPTWQIDEHGEDLKYWEAQIRLAQATNSFRKARGNCINRWGKCDQYEHCATREG